MSIIELLQQVGAENVKVQFLDQCVVGNISTSQKTGLTTISFKTNCATPADFLLGGGNMGIIVWVPRSKMPKPTQ